MGVRSGIPESPGRRPGDTFAGFLTGEPTKDQRNVDILLDTIAEVVSYTNLDDLSRFVVDKTLDITGAERGILMLFDEDGELRVEVARNRDRQDITGTLVYSHTVPDRVLAEGREIALLDAASEQNASLGQSIIDLRLLSIMGAPLKLKDKNLGVLYVDSKAVSREEFADSDLLLFKALAYILAIAIENARLVREAIERQKLKQSLLIAQDIQRRLLPVGGLEIERYDIYGLSRAADETGGDYFDFIRSPNGHLGLVVGDVSGHGIGAALFMATARALLRAFASTHDSLDRIFFNLNNALERDMGAGSFMTLFYGDLDPRENLLRFVRAGHNEPLLYRGETGKFEELSGPGMGLGILRDYAYEVSEPVPLRAGDILYLFTDGIPEARNPAKEQFGMERMKNTILENRQRPAREIVEKIVQAVVEFAGPAEFDDDLTLIAAKVLEVD